ncbi:MAG: PQQ-binding-like beta-propeller repeat protein [Gemmataceae bacterium]|nr:PQQ-binding-like beta-propeller repeat protein [Gemmata sp.]MDW8196590.1 PQQ-binding-like beta-propeller repeat protein [Gemmataceae bacterium]
MSIVVECPHCQTRFNLQDDMNGKTMRCPNLECRQSFVVKAKQAAPPPPVYAPPPPSASKPAKPQTPPPPPAPEIVEAVVVEASLVSKPKVKEVVWSQEKEPPPVRKSPQPVQPELVDDSGRSDVLADIPLRRKRKRSWGPIILIAMSIFIVMAIGGSILYIGYFQQENERQLAAVAQEQYQKGEWAEAAKSYEKLLSEYPSSDKSDEYRFFAALSGVQKEVRSVTNRENYAAALQRFYNFLQEYRDSPLAKPTSGYGRDILEAGKKLAEDMASFGADRLQAFRANRVAKGGELGQAEKAITDGRALIERIQPFRATDDDDAPFQRLRDSFHNIEQGITRERERTAALAAAREQLENPTDAIIQAVVSDLQARGFHDDPEAIDLIALAKGKLRDLVRYEEAFAEAQPPPPTAAATLLFVTPLGREKFVNPNEVDSSSTVFLCVCRGILYAFQEFDGQLLWAMRVGGDILDPPVMARVQLETGPTEVAVVASNVGNAPAIAGVVVPTGKIRWYQPLPAPVAGPAVLVGTRAFVPLRDPLGTIYEFDVATGTRWGWVRIGQPVAERGVVLRPGTNLLYVVADARRVYVLDTGGIDENGRRVHPRCVQVMATGHLPGTLRVPPLFIGPEGMNPGPALATSPEGPVDRFLVFAQAEGTERTLLRAFAVRPPAPSAGGTIPETPAKPLVELPVPGWVSSMPITDNERLALITDTGEFRLFGVNQPENRDRPLFPYPHPAPLKAPGERIPPGLVVPGGGESTYWLLTAGQLQKAQLAMVPSRGQEVVLTGSPRPIGEPVHPAQVNTRRDTACVVVRSPSSSACRAVVFSLKDGEILWERQLGLVPAKASPRGDAAQPIAQGDKFLVVDESGAIFAIPATNAVAIGQTLTIPETWRLKPPPEKALGATVVVAAADGQVVFTLTPVSRDRPTWLIRRIVQAEVSRDDEVLAPEALAGQPAVVGGYLLVPAADGFVYRYLPGEGGPRAGTLVAGPKWHDERRGVCSITPLSDSAFATSDGGKKWHRWEWPTPNGKFRDGGSWELNQNTAGLGVVLPPAEVGSPPRWLVADSSGTVWLFAADRAAGPLRCWRPGADSGLPPGPPTSRFAILPTEMKPLVAYVVDDKAVVAIDPEFDQVAWMATMGDAPTDRLLGTPQPIRGGQYCAVTDLGGNIRILNAVTGAEVAKPSVGIRGAVPVTAGVINGNTVLTLLTDGSATVIELPPLAAPAPKP